MVRIFCVALLSFLATPANAGPFEDCILQNMKGVQAPNAAVAIARACREKTTPLRCRDEQIVKRLEARVRPYDGPVDQLKTPGFLRYEDVAVENRSDAIATERVACMRLCETASIWSRKIGECSTD